ncbi:hypothetical protein F4678DRAFT_466396 [Xylaria arbuscula]|nr:hypothetical protein F4678DRAFT_466396 [Xylaria arbuscula]
MAAARCRGPLLLPWSAVLFESRMESTFVLCYTPSSGNGVGCLMLVSPRNPDALMLPAPLCSLTEGGGYGPNPKAKERLDEKGKGQVVADGCSRAAIGGSTVNLMVLRTATHPNRQDRPTTTGQLV